MIHYYSDVRKIVDNKNLVLATDERSKKKGKKRGNELIRYGV